MRNIHRYERFVNAKLLSHLRNTYDLKVTYLTGGYQRSAQVVITLGIPGCVTLLATDLHGDRWSIVMKKSFAYPKHNCCSKPATAVQDPVPSMLGTNEAHQGQGDVMDCATWVLEPDTGGREGYWTYAAALVWHWSYPGGLRC